MKNWKKLTPALIGALGVAIGITFWSGHTEWNKETERLIRELEKRPAGGKTVNVASIKMDELPSPVRRYFSRVLRKDQPVILTARLLQKGEFYLNERWVPFVAKQNFSTQTPGFVWNADMKMNALMNVSVRDALVNDYSSMKAKIFSRIVVMNIESSKELLSGSLQRYLAEAVWFPTALLPSESLSWSEIDDNRALATLTSGGTTVALEFRFNETGEITEVFSPSRYRQVRGGFEPTPWLGRFRDYKEVGGVLIPLEGEVEWQLPSGPLLYWKGRIEKTDYSLSPIRIATAN